MQVLTEEDLILALMSFGYRAEEKEVTFADVIADSYYYDAVRWAVNKGITKGVNETQFASENPCTRAQIVTFLWRAEGEPEPITTENPFKDVEESNYYYKPVLWAYENGITSGVKPSLFQEDGICQRAQAVIFIYRMYN